MKEELRFLLDKHADEIAQFVRYFAVSAVALCIDVTVYWTLLSAAKFAFIAAAGGYVCGVLSHYVMSSRVVFAKRFKKRGLADESPTIARFFAAGFAGLIVTSGVVGLLADVVGMHPLLARIAAAGCSFCVVFLCMRLFVFNQPQPPASAVPAA